MRCFSCGSMSVSVAGSTEEMAAAAAADFAASAAGLLVGRADINVVFSGAQSQGAFHAALRGRRDIPWERINAYAVDEFWAPGMPAANAVSAQPRRDLYSHVAVKSVNLIDFSAPDPAAEAERYEALVMAHPPDICCLGIGISGHLALNEPGQADFTDPRAVRLVDVCELSKRQLENDPNFRALPSIPGKGITITVPTLMSTRAIIVVVPYAEKAPIVGRVLREPISEALPATVLRRFPSRLYLDAESGAAARGL